MSDKDQMEDWSVRIDKRIEELEKKLKLERKVKVWDAKVINKMNKEIASLTENIKIHDEAHMTTAEWLDDLKKEIASLRRDLTMEQRKNRLRYKKHGRIFEREIAELKDKVIALEQYDAIDIPEQLAELKERVEGLYKSIHGISPDQADKTEKKEYDKKFDEGQMFFQPIETKKKASGGDKVEEMRRSHPLGEPSPNSDISLQSKPPEPKKVIRYCQDYNNGHCSWLGGKCKDHKDCKFKDRLPDATGREERSK